MGLKISFIINQSINHLFASDQIMTSRRWKLTSMFYQG